MAKVSPHGNKTGRSPLKISNGFPVLTKTLAAYRFAKVSQKEAAVFSCKMPFAWISHSVVY
jgi:hypothetical protein